jgi:hypothetical protein
MAENNMRWSRRIGNESRLPAYNAEVVLAGGHRAKHGKTGIIYA